MHPFTKEEMDYLVELRQAVDKHDRQSFKSMTPEQTELICDWMNYRITGKRQRRDSAVQDGKVSVGIGSSKVGKSIQKGTV